MRALLLDEVTLVSGGAWGGGSTNGIPVLSANNQKKPEDEFECPAPWKVSNGGGGGSSAALDRLCSWAGAVAGVAAGTITVAGGVSAPVAGLVGLGVGTGVQQACQLMAATATGGIPTAGSAGCGAR